MNGQADCGLHDIDVVALADHAGEARKILVKTIVDCEGDDCSRDEFKMLHGGEGRVADTVRSFQEIVRGDHDDIPEQAFYMQGSIDQVVERAAQMKAEG